MAGGDTNNYDKNFKQNQENIHNVGNYVHPHNMLSTKLDKDYLDNLNSQVNDPSNIVHKTILDSTVKEIIQNFTIKITQIIDNIMLDIEEMNNDENEEDTLDWMVKLMNICYKIFGHIMKKDNCLYVGILFVLISLFVHYFNITQPSTK